MNLLAPVSDIMTTSIITVSSNDTLEDVKAIFEKHRIHHIPVVNQGELVGMISQSDFLLFSHQPKEELHDTFLEKIRLKNYRVQDTMTQKLATLEHDDRINVALEIFRVNRFHALPVLRDKKLVGILTTFDIIDFLARDQMAEMKYS